MVGIPLLSLKIFKFRGWERPRRFYSCAIKMLECVVESALKFKNSEISLKKLKRDFSVKSAWKTRDVTVKVREKLVILESPINF